MTTISAIVLTFTLWFAAAPVAPVHASTTVGQDSVTLTGCVERDAASRVDVYKLIVKSDGGSRIYRLTASGDIDIAAALGRTVEITGSVGPKDVLTVQRMRTVSERCS